MDGLCIALHENYPVVREWPQFDDTTIFIIGVLWRIATLLDHVWTTTLLRVNREYNQYNAWLIEAKQTTWQTVLVQSCA
jgi:hypothetical protein